MLSVPRNKTHPDLYLLLHGSVFSAAVIAVCNILAALSHLLRELQKDNLMPRSQVCSFSLTLPRFIHLGGVPATELLLGTKSSSWQNSEVFAPFHGLSPQISCTSGYAGKFGKKNTIAIKLHSSRKQFGYLGHLQIRKAFVNLLLVYREGGKSLENRNI